MTTINRQAVEDKLTELQNEELAYVASQSLREREAMQFITLEHMEMAIAKDDEWLERVKTDMHQQHDLLIELAEEGVYVPSVRL